MFPCVSHLFRVQGYGNEQSRPPALNFNSFYFNAGDRQWVNKGHILGEREV